MMAMPALFDAFNDDRPIAGHTHHLEITRFSALQSFRRVA